MKKKIILGLSIFALMFFFGGVYIITTMTTTIYELHNLAALHHVVALRKDLLMSIEENQNNIRVQGTRYAAGAGTHSGSSMMETAKRCLTCHHSPRADQMLNNLRNQIELYHGLTQKILTAPPRSSAEERQAGVALRLGDNLITRVKEIITVTNGSLDK